VGTENKLEAHKKESGPTGTEQIESWNKFAQNQGQTVIDNQSKGE
jgi:hypothetical protein